MKPIVSDLINQILKQIVIHISIQFNYPLIPRNSDEHCTEDSGISEVL